jgi:hypothetical protein
MGKRRGNMARKSFFKNMSKTTRNIFEFGENAGEVSTKIG